MHAYKEYNPITIQNYQIAVNALHRCKYNKALDYFDRAAEDRYPTAYLYLGVLYKNGYGLPKDKKKGAHFHQLVEKNVPWFQEATNPVLYPHAADAQNNLGYLFYVGLGVQKDYKKAFELFALAAAQGHADAQNNLGIFYENGLGVTKDYKKAFELFALAAAQEHADAQNSLGIFYENGNKGLEQDYKKAFEFYKTAADQGHISAQNNLGTLYYNGHSVEKNIVLAFKYYKLSADQGSPDAWENIGNAFFEGALLQQVPHDLVLKLKSQIGNKAPSNMYCAIYCWKEALKHTEDEEQRSVLQKNIAHIKKQYPEIEKMNETSMILTRSKTKAKKKEAPKITWANDYGIELEQTRIIEPRKNIEPPQKRQRLDKNGRSKDIEVEEINTRSKQRKLPNPVPLSMVENEGRSTPKMNSLDRRQMLLKQRERNKFGMFRQVHPRDAIIIDPGPTTPPSYRASRK